MSSGEVPPLGLEPPAKFALVQMVVGVETSTLDGFEELGEVPEQSGAGPGDPSPIGAAVVLRRLDWGAITVLVLEIAAAPHTEHEIPVRSRQSAFQKKSKSKQGAIVQDHF